MSLPPRIEYPGAIQHVAVNGNNRQAMFLADGDRITCLSLLASTAQRYKWDVLSYCLMETHWHALIRTTEATLARGMQRLNSCYSRTFNQTHGRSGHSIRHRYMSVPVETGEHLLELSRYIPLNPVRAGLSAHPEDWPWSSHRAQLGLEPRPRWLGTRWLRDLHGSPAALRRFVAEGMAEPGTHWVPGSDPTVRPRRPEARTAPQRPAWV